MDHDAEFEEFFDSVFERAKALARRLRLDPHEAEDVAMEALTRAYARWRKLHDVDWREAWVIKVTANLAIDALRRSARPAPRAGESAAFEDATVARLDVSRALRALPRRQCKVIVLRYLADLPEHEGASALRICRGTVKSHAHRGQETLAVATPAPLIVSPKPSPTLVPTPSQKPSPSVATGPWHPPAPASFVSSETAQANAESVASSLLAQVALPTGAAAITVRPTVLAQVSAPLTPNLVDVDTLWAIPSPRRHDLHPRGPPSPWYVDLQRVVRFLRRARLRGAGFRFHVSPLAPGLRSAQLLFAATTDGQGGTNLRVDAQVVWLLLGSSSRRRLRGTNLRVDAQVVWLPGRTPGEQVTAADHVVDVSRGTYSGGPTTTLAVTDPNTVVALADLFNGLQTEAPSTSSCPLILASSPVYTLAFGPSPRAPPDFVANDGDACAIWRVTVGGQTAEALWDPNLVESLITGLFPSASPTPNAPTA